MAKKKPSEIEEVKKIFLSDDLDEETRAENLAQINDWETSLINSKNYVAWQQHDITQEIVKKLKDAYKENGLMLAINRNLTEPQRQSLFSKQDAILWLLSLIVNDAQEMLQQTNREIKQALNATS
jgi:hypothetical protein